jgi:rhodanese-related sulfurtransferase
MRIGIIAAGIIMVMAQGAGHRVQGLPIEDCRLPIVDLKAICGEKGMEHGESGYRLSVIGGSVKWNGRVAQVSRYRAQGTGHRVQGLPIEDCRLPIEDLKAVCGMRRKGHGAWSLGHGATGVADTIVAVDPDKVFLEASLDPAVIIIDVRMKMEYRRGHIEKAVHLPGKKDLMEFTARTAASRPLYLYCTTETRSRQAAKLLIEAGFERVFIIEGGLNKWKAYGLPIEKR